MTSLHDHTALELHQLLQRGEVSPVELTGHYLARIERLNPEVGAFATVTPEAALERARHVEESADRGPLWGMPVADKDLNRRAGVPAGFGSRVFAGFVPDASDELVQAVDTAGAVSLGKTPTPESGLPSYTEGVGTPTRNPWDSTLGAGGSSGGAAAAVASECCPSRPAPTAAARSASPRPRADSWASSPAAAGCRRAPGSQASRVSASPGRSPARSPMPPCSSTD